jgi:hypothetical protein
MEYCINDMYNILVFISERQFVLHGVPGCQLITSMLIHNPVVCRSVQVIS